MGEKEFNIQELKLTAMLYAVRPGVVDHVRRTGHLPEYIPSAGNSIGANVLRRERGRDPDLTEDEQLVLEAILRDRRLPGGAVHLVPKVGRDE